jgi:molybdopterin/thiamine biosynthesis adenylyltransferase
MALSREESARYARHIVLKDIGGAGQQKLKGAKVLVVGAGGLGSPVIAYLAAAGVGTIGIADDDAVSLSNLQRQIIHGESGVGEQKTQSAARFASGLNSHIDIVTHDLRLNSDNAPAVFADYDIIIDGSDTFETRREMAGAAEKAQKILVSGGVSMFDGSVTVLAPHLAGADGEPNPGFDDLFPDMPDHPDLPACEQVGVLGAVTGVIGTLMAMEAIKLITGVGKPLIGRLLLYDGRAAKFTEMRYARRKNS